ncbi:MAG: PDZ domain-containing protein, partial [Nitrospirae bacterium]|nr:PDZ domain-containing protein [Nitrospirota bacterium]
IIARVDKGGPADKAGLRSARETPRGRIQLGDVIMKVAGESVTIFDDLVRILDRYKVGDKIKIQVRREGKPVDVTVKLAELQ